MYQPGLHIVADISAEESLLRDCESFQKRMKELISIHGLNILGEIWHPFENAGFTALICLTDSHISIHTWPEYNKATFDVFLSNYRRVNDGTARSIAEAIIHHFNGVVTLHQEIKR